MANSHNTQFMTMTMIGVPQVVHFSIKEDGGTTIVMVLISMALTECQLFLELVQHLQSLYGMMAATTLTSAV